MEENKVMETTETMTEDLVPVSVDEECIESTSSSKGWIVKAVGVLAAGAAVYGLTKCKGLIEKRTINKLKKKGYTILEPGEDVVEDDVEDYEDYEDFVDDSEDNNE